MISIIIPSMNRPQALAACVNFAVLTTLGAKVEIVCVIDEYVNSYNLLREVVKQYHAGYHNFEIILNEKRVGAIAAWNQGLRLSSGDIIVFAGDDLMWGEKWLDHALIALDQKLLGDGMVGFNDLHRDGNELSTHYLATRSFIRNHLGGRIAFPIFDFYCNDTVANRLAKDAGKFYWCEESVVTHNHYTNGRRPKDSLDAENETKLEGDIRKFEAWVQRGCKIEWDSVI